MSDSNTRAVSQITPTIGDATAPAPMKEVVTAHGVTARPRRAALKTALLAAVTLLALSNPLSAQTNGANTMQRPGAATRNDLRTVTPALDKYAQETLFGNLWRRPDLTPRDRSIVTLAALVARNQTVELPLYAERALDSGVRPGEVSELITHLAFYSGWGNAMAAVVVVKDVFAARGIGADQLPAASPELLPLDETAEAERVAQVARTVRPTVAGLDQFTTDVLFRDLWLRPGLAPRDRSLVTVSALIASSLVAQVPYHLNRAMDNGLTRAQASEVVAHLAFYAGWPNAFSAVPVVKSVFDSRAN